MPFLNIPTVPGGKYEIRTADLIRAIPMVTSPFLRAKQHIDLWFVPYNLLWSRFNEFMVDKDEKLSSALKDRDYLPHFHLKELLDTIAVRQTDKDIVGQDYRTGAYRLLDALGYPTYKYFFGGSMTDEEADKAVNPFPLLAYNYIWYTEYRQQYYDNGTHLYSSSSILAPELYNVDTLRCNTEDTADLIRSHIDMVPMCQMRYRCWKKDLFTGLMPSTQFGNVSQLPIADSILIQNRVFTDQDINGGDTDEATFGQYLVSNSDDGRWRRSGGQQLVDQQSIISDSANRLYQSGSGASGISHDHATRVSHLGVESRAQSTGGLDVLALRKAEAVQIWRENALRAGNYIEDNFEAHYGVKPKSHMYHHAVPIGSIDAPLNIGDIDSHAQAGDGVNQQLADVAGKGISSLGKGKFNFQTNEFGVILGLVSMLPETEYMSTGIKRENQYLEREDFYIPEYAKIGLQPVDSSTFYFGGTRSVNLGYAPRDYGYKQQLDMVHLDFFNGGIGTNGVFRSWTSPKYDVYDSLAAIAQGGIQAMPLSCLYVNPKIFDVNFSVGVANSRQFQVDYYFDVDGIQPMPVTGMPSY